MYLFREKTINLVTRVLGYQGMATGVIPLLSVFERSPCPDHTTARSLRLGNGW